MNISDFLNAQSLEKLAIQSVIPGNVYKITMDRSNGIIPKVGYETRDKYFIVLGFDSQGYVYGGVIINSEIHQKLSSRAKEQSIPIYQAKYPFLRYDSFVDCQRLKSASLKSFSGWEYLGYVEQHDLEIIKSKLQSSPFESKAHLAQFGL